MRAVLLGVLALVGGATPAAAATWTTVDISAYSNWRVQSPGGMSGVPTGTTNFAGIPFLSNASGNNSWNGDIATGADPRVLDIPVSARSVSTVRLLLISIWGQTSGTYCTVAVVESAGEVDSLQLVGNQHFRDYNSGPWTGTINGTRTQNAWNNGACDLNVGHRLDVQTFTMPAQYVSARLDSVRFTDTGADNFQRIVLHGVTVDAGSSQAYVGVDAAPAPAAPLRAWPNPARSRFRVALGATTRGGASTIEVLDVRGRRVGHALTAPAGDLDAEISPATLGRKLPPGIWFVEVRGGGVMQRTRVVVLP